MENRTAPETKAFQIEQADNVATLLAGTEGGSCRITGNSSLSTVIAVESIPEGHKIALQDIREGDMIVKYGVPIGRATRHITQGQWVHLHCMTSNYDERSSHLDPLTGAPMDIDYSL